MRASGTLILAAWLCWAGAAAAVGSCGPLAAGGLDTVLRPARIIGGGPAHFLLDPTPSCSEAACRKERGAYVLPGDIVAIGEPAGGAVCAHFFNGRTETGGWLPANRVQAGDDSAQPLSAWSGRWQRDGLTELRITGEGRAIHASGETALDRGDDAARTGAFDDTGVRADGMLHIGSGADPDDCRLAATLTGRYLAVLDNGRCGGLGVSFSGFYAKAR